MNSPCAFSIDMLIRTLRRRGDTHTIMARPGIRVCRTQCLKLKTSIAAGDFVETRLQCCLARSKLLDDLL